MLRAIHLSLLLLCGFALSAQTLPAKRVYFVGNRCFVTDSLGTTSTDYAASQVSVSFYPNLPTPSIRLRTPDDSGYLRPNQFLKSSGLPWGISVTTAFSAWNDAVGSLAGVGGGTGGGTSGGTVALANDLVTSDASKALAAPQGGALKSLIDANTTAIGQRLLTTTFNNQVTTQQGIDNTQNTNITAAANAASTAQSTANSAQTTANNAQPKETGKGLSSNDYTAAEKAKVAVTSGTNTGDQVFNQAGQRVTLSGGGGFFDLPVVTPPTTSTTTSTPGTPFDAAAAADLANRIVANTASINNALGPLTRAYLNNVIAAGGTINRKVLNEWDQIEREGTANGALAQMKEIYPFQGTTLAAALVKYKSATSATSLVSVGSVAFAESDYNPATGLTLLTNSGKKLSTGFIPSVQGLGNTDFSFIYQGGTFIAEGSSYMFGTVPATTSVDSPIRISNQSSQLGNAGIPTPQYDYDVVVATNQANSWGGFLNGLRTTGKSSANTGSVITDEIILFSAKRQNGIEYFAKGTFLFCAFGNTLTDAQAKWWSNAVTRLTNATRQVGQGTATVAIIGDSNTKGAGASWATNGNGTVWSEQIAQKTGLRHVSVAQGSSRLATDDVNGGYIGFINKYQDMLNWAVLPQQIYIMYGTNDENNNDGTANGDATLIADFGTKLETIIRAFQARKIRVVVCTPAYNGVASDAKQQAYNARIALAAKNTFCPFVDVYTPFKDEPDLSIYFPSNDASKLHYNDLGHRFVSGIVWNGAQGQLSRRPTLDFPSIAAGSFADLTVNILNAEAGMATNVTAPATIESGLVIQSFVSGSGTVTVRAYNQTTAAIDPAAQRFKVIVLGMAN